MMGKESFEDKIRQQLENYEVPYKKSYWKSYVNTFPAPTWAFWKMWWMPYLFSSLLFGVAWSWFGSNVQQLSVVADNRDTVVVQHTVVTRDTLLIRDTIVLYVRERALAQAGASDKIAAIGQIINLPNNYPKYPTSSAEMPSNVTLDSNQTNSASVQQNSLDLLQHKPHEASTDDTLTTFLTTNQHKGANDSTTSKVESQSLVPSSAAENSTMTIDSLEQAYHDEDLLKMDDSKRNQPSVFFSAGPRFSGLSPFDYANFDTRYGAFVGGAFQLDWHHWQLEAGVQYGLQKNEIDDLSLVSQSQKLLFPGYSNLTTEPDEIGVMSSHLLVPMQLRYTLLDYRMWRFQVAGGVLGNVVLSESFKYYFEDTDRDFVNRTRLGKEGISLSHLNVGLGTSYAWNQNIELQAVLNYYHPLRPLGVNELRVGALSLQLGINWLLNH